MEQDFRRRFLETRTQLDLINIIFSPFNTRQYTPEEFSNLGLNRSSPAELLVDFILKTAGIDSYANDYYDYIGAVQLAKDINFLKNRLNLMTVEYLISIISNPSNGNFFPGVNINALQMASKDQLIDIILKAPGAFIDNNIIADYRHLYQIQDFDKLFALRAQDPTYNPTRWKPKPHQVDHINRLYSGLVDPNTPRCVMDASPTGKGKTIANTLCALALKTRFLLIFCPKKVAPKWDDALRGLGLFNYRISNYSGILGNSRSKDTKRWARYRPDPSGNPKKIVDNNWIQITKTMEQGKYEERFDWSFLPDQEPDSNLGGCTVIWDEAQNVKGKTSKIGLAFEQFIDYLKKERRKYVRGILLTGTAMEKIEDLPYMLYALGYIPLRQPSLQKAFILKDLLPNFATYLGPGIWKPEFEQLVPNAKLILFIRYVAGRQNRFSQIPDSVSFLLSKLKLISAPAMEETNTYTKNVVVPNFKSLMGSDYTPELDALKDKEKLLAYLRHLSTLNDPRYPKEDILPIIDFIFENPIIFQAIKIEPQDMELFIAINREIQETLLDMLQQGDKKDMLGRIQRTMSQLEELKLTPFTRFGRKILDTPLPGGAKGSLVISMLRNNSVRHFAWRFEAILTLEELTKQNLPLEQVLAVKNSVIQVILTEYQNYNQSEQYARQANAKFQIKSTFTQYSTEQLQALSFEDLLFEYTKWHKYLDVNKFEYVCVFVGDFGNPNPTDFDLESADEKDWIKESKKIEDWQGIEALKLFQESKRRVLVTNMYIAREGIDLHDISEGGMHPRGALISPGIIARFFLQMIGRFVREGQTSNSLRIAGFIDNISGMISWEKKFMDKLSEKVKYIQALHEGEISLDILENIDLSGESIIREILNEMKLERTYRMQDVAPSGGEDIFGDQPALVTSGGRNSLGSSFAPQSGPVEQFLQRVFSRNPAQIAQARKQLEVNTAVATATASTSTTTIQPGQPIQNSTLKIANPDQLLVASNDMFLLFDTTQNDESVLPKIISAITEFKLNARYYMRLDTNAIRGVIIYRPGFLVDGLIQEDLIVKVATVTKLGVDRKEYKPGELNVPGFNPKLKIPKVSVIFENATSIVVTPRYPIELVFPVGLFGSSLQGSSVDGLTIRFMGIIPRIILSFYAIKSIALFQYPDIFESFGLNDVNKIVPTIDKRFLITSFIKNGKYTLLCDREIIRNFPVALSAVQAFVNDMASKLLFQDYKEEDNDMASVTISPKYHETMNKLIGRKPEDRSE